jgi:heme/copper-type cytochrome/quinol oxidase subunit 1
MGGMTGVFLASIPLDLQAHDTFFVVAHFHYVLIGGALFPLFGGFHYWFPKFTGRMMDERLGKLSFWILFVGFNLTFFPMHWLGMAGMTRRVYTYIPGLGWDHANLAATIGAFVILLGGSSLSPTSSAAAAWARGQEMIRGRRARWSGKQNRHLRPTIFQTFPSSPAALRFGRRTPSALSLSASVRIAVKFS